MNEAKPIIFSGDSVRGILDGRKTMTRRVVKPQGAERADYSERTGAVYLRGDRGGHAYRVPCPYGKPGDRLWVRENGWERPVRDSKMMREGADTWERYYYDADGYTDLDRDQFKEWGFKRRPSIRMPRWASRITLEITGVRVEKLQEISEEDARAEGFCSSGTLGRDWSSCVDNFAAAWESLNGKRHPWASNCWVWVIEFRRHTGGK